MVAIPPRLALKLSVMENYLASETVIADAGPHGCKIIVLQPAFLTSKPARRLYGWSWNTTGLDEPELPLRKTKREIRWEDVAEEMLRVASLPVGEREERHGHAVYLVDMKDGVSV